MREINYNDTYTLIYELDGINVTLYHVEDMFGNDKTSYVDHHDWEYLEEWITSQLTDTFCYFNEC